MKKYIPLLFFCASITVVACAQTRKTTGTEAASPAAQQAPPVATPFDWVMISRGACYGRCPIYSVKIMPDGLIQYYGKRFVKYPGMYEKQLDPKEVTDIFEHFQTYRIDTSKDNYTSHVADLPTLTVEYSRNGEKRTITNANFGPGALRMIAEEIDALAQVDETWKKTGDVAPE